MKNNDEFRHEWRRSLLTQMMGEGVLDADELSLFEWYARENSEVIDSMLAAEQEFNRQQNDAGADLGDVNDSGMVAVEYYIKRARYADIIYMASLLESYLARACENLTVALGDNNVVFRPEELTGDKWTKRQKFLERYGGFVFPNDAWSALQTLIRVRNILVHENGCSDEISNSDRIEIGTRTGISITRHELVIENEYVKECFEAFRELFKFLDNQVNQAVDRSIRPQVLKSGR